MTTQPHAPAHPAPEGPHGWKGLTKREEFAKAALEGLLAHQGCCGAEIQARAAVGFADELIRALNAIEPDCDPVPELDI